MTCGIYLGSPKNCLTDKVYIGQSTDIYSRIRRHNSDMKLGVHSKKMQEAYASFGDFEWEIICECSEGELDSKETYYISLFDSCNNGLNTYEDSQSVPILYGLANGNARKEDIPTYKTVLELTISNPHYSRHKIAELAGTKEYTVNSIWYGKSACWLAELFPVEYGKVQALLGSRRIGGASAEQQGIVYPVLLSPCLESYNVYNISQFALCNKLDRGDLANLLNMKVASVKGWIVKDLDNINPALHSKYYATNRGHYKKQFDLYKYN